MVKARKLMQYAALLASVGVWWLAGLYLYLSPNLPEADTLRNITLQTPMRVVSREGALIGQFGEQKRKPLQFDQIPQSFIDALLAAEDDGFFSHSGIEPLSLGRAISELVLTGKKGSGGSTLTMQVARNYFLSLERTFLRKFNEILLALEIEQTLSKAEIFELYVNRVFLGHRAYGFEAAAETYYGKSLADLSLPQHAMLAGIPKAPSRNNPLSNPDKGKIRRDWILGRMASLGKITEAEKIAARNTPVSAGFFGQVVEVDADYVAEMVRQEMVERFGNAAYNDGYVVFTTIDADMQQAAHDALLPTSIQIKSVRSVSDDFHARFSVTGKRYKYRIYLGRAKPSDDRYVWACRDIPLDLEAMNAAAQRLIGTHDFTAYSASHSKDNDPNPTKTIHSLSVTQRGKYLTLTAEGSGFLYKMVRTFAGALYAVGRGRLSPADVSEILASKQRTHRIVTAPGQGLSLDRVFYR